MFGLFKLGVQRQFNTGEAEEPYMLSPRGTMRPVLSTFHALPGFNITINNRNLGITAS
jgi:hypothetical protein